MYVSAKEIQLLFRQLWSFLFPIEIWLQNQLFRISGFCICNLPFCEGSCMVGGGCSAKDIQIFFECCGPFYFPLRFGCKTNYLASQVFAICHF